MKNKNIKLFQKKISILYLSTILSCIPLVTYAKPEGGIVSAGKASISHIENTTHINQVSDKAVIDWQSFDITSNETTHFHQPSNNSITLNRINSDHATHINGQLKANGNIILINQNGIMFGNNARVDVNAIIASTIDIDNDKFIQSSNHLEFNKPGKIDAAIINNGYITAKEAGLVGLIAPNVINNGLIVANSGQVQLSSGNNFTLDLYGDKLIEVSVSSKLKSQLVMNKGIIEADGGKIILTAAAGKEIVNNLIIIEGELRAPAVAEKNGEIVIYAEGSNAVKNNIAANKGLKKGNSEVRISAKIDVSGVNPGESGGKVTINGDNIALLDGTLINASGYEGLNKTTEGKELYSPRPGSAGGDIKIGGDYLGQGTTPSAKNLYVDPGALILNDSINNGDAGRTIFWSDDTTNFYGNVYSRSLGGNPVDKETWNAQKNGNAGDGGFVETSGRKYLDAHGHLDLTASNGENGTYLLDPEGITIYGNFSPQYLSTDGSIDLSGALNLWLDSNNEANIDLSYQSVSTTANGSQGSNVLTVGSTTNIEEGVKIRLTDASSGDTYIVQSISGTTLTLTENLTANYSGDDVYAGYVQAWTDGSGNSNDATQSTSNRKPFWINNKQNSKAILNFDGSNDGFEINLDFLAEVSHTAFISSKTTNYKNIYGAANRWGSYNQRLHVGFNGENNYRENYWGNDYYPSVSSAFSKDNYNILTYQWSPGSHKAVYANTNLEGQSSNAGTIGTMSGGGRISGNIVNMGYWGGEMAEIMMYTAELSGDNINLLNQHQSAKWGIPLSPPGSGSTEAAKAMASTARGDIADGYSSFTTNYLNELSNNANIDLQSSSGITLDFKGDTLTLADDKNFSLTAGGDINSLSSGSIVTNRTASNGNIALTAGGSIDISNLDLSANNGGTVTLNGASATFDASNSVNLNLIGGGTSNSLNLLGISAPNKVYDTTTSITLIGTPTITSPATVTGTVTGSFADKNVGTDKAVNFSGLSISISPSEPISYTYISPSLTADITPANLIVSGLSAINKIYDATVSASLSGTPTISPLVGDVTNISGTAVGSFDNKNVAANKAITISGLTASGTDGGNYQLVAPSSLTADITQAPLVVRANNHVVIYREASPQLTYLYTGLAGSDSDASFIGNLSYDGSGIGIHKIIQNTLSAQGNYIIGSYIPGRIIIGNPRDIIPPSILNLSNHRTFNIMTSSINNIKQLSNHSFGDNLTNQIVDAFEIEEQLKLFK